ncbi:MBL fold metallo-hydrolase [Hansschlegelia zhihuaiae]|uniref:MBL fold metallo-hydrolase n=1 Tax=Hansschlegelia zhihuaiae TaxID=405005 RepID=A0A4Q0MGB8_9HYPH|nr:MBL fold metallo-hydrolase [Hansschlegelia zhihuaiae]RXF72029.1 MBL fold metallo-hydrolase [Hansschlegelia zhihuaiae]
MTAMSRRTILAGAGAAAAGPVALGGAKAAAPAAGRQSPGVYRYKVGSYEVTALTDGVARRPLDASFVRNAALDEVREALSDAFIDGPTIPITFTTLVVNTGSRLVLIDAGTGGRMAPTAGQLYENMAAAGIDPKAIDTVLVSHFHPDHIGGIRLKEGGLAFPNAEVAVPEAEWAFWMDDGQMSRAPDGLKNAFKTVRTVFGPLAKEVRRFKGEAETAPGVVAIPAPGHTPGHTAFRVASDKDQLIVWSDTTNHPALFVRNPGWHAVFDMDAEAAETTRRRMLDMVANDRLRVAGYHFPFPAVGHIAQRGAREYAFVPEMWNPAL